MGITAIKVYDADAPATLIKSCTSAYRRGWLDQLNDVGSGTFVIHATDADLAAAPTLKNYGNIVRFELDGTDRFAFIIENRSIPPAAQGEETEHAWTFSGRGVLAILEDAIVLPETALPSYARQRRFDFTAIAYDDSSWVAATVVQQQSSTSGPIAAYYGQPADWPDASGYWIWSRAVTGAGVPAGTSYFRKQFTLASDTVVGVFATFDNGGRLWLDGEQLIDTGPREGAAAWDVTKRSENVTLSAGTHELAVEAWNFDFVAGGQSPAAVLVAVMEVDEATGLTTAVVLEHTDSTWVCLDYPASVPGMSTGHILRILLEEAQARGALNGVTLDFTDTDDANSVAWVEEPDIALDIGTSLLDVIRTFIEQYVDVSMSPTLALSVYNKGTRGSDLTGTVSLAIGVDFIEQNTSGQGHLTNAILARDTTGLLTVKEDGTSLAAHKRRETYLELALAPTETRAQALSEQVLIEFAYPTVEVTATVTSGSGPYVDWGPGDMILAPGPDGSAVDTNIVSLSIEEDEVGTVLCRLQGMQDDGSS